MKKNILYYFAFAAVVSFMQSACEDGKNEFLRDFGTILYFRDSGEMEVSLYKTGEKTTLHLSVVKAGSEQGTVTGVDVGILSEAALEAHNVSSGTEYRLLPADCYEVDVDHLDFASSDAYKMVTVSVFPETVENYLDDSATYVIPLELSNSADSVNSEKNRVFFSVKEVLTPSIGFETAGYVPAADITDNTGTTVVTQTVVMPIDNQWDFDCLVEVDESVLLQYNSDNNDVIEMMDEEAYSLEFASFVAGSNVARLTITIDDSRLAWGRQALPLRITGASNENFAVDEAASTCLVGINHAAARSELAEIAMTTDRLSSNATATYDGAGLPGLVDGNLSTIWHGDYSYGLNDPVYGQYIDFHLPNAVNHIAYDFWARSENTNGAPVTTDLYASSDGQNWTKLGVVATAFSAGGEEYNSGVFSSATKFTYLRFAVIESAVGDCRTSSYWNGAEIKIYGL